MIQTQLLKVDRPYQIISAAGQVGIQVATLIVTEEKTLDHTGYWIDTHSHPVVNYAVKDNLTEDLKYWDGNPEDEWKYTQRLQPEGAVWNKVEVRDVRVLGLVGAKNPTVDLQKFVSLIPGMPSKSIYEAHRNDISIWGPKTDIRIRNLKWALERVDLRCDTWTQNVSDHINRDGYLHIYLSLIDYDEEDCLVKVQIRESDYKYLPMPIDEIAFGCCLSEAPEDFINTVVKCMAELDQQFIRSGEKIIFIYWQESEIKDKWGKMLEQTVERVNEAWKNRNHDVF